MSVHDHGTKELISVGHALPVLLSCVEIRTEHPVYNGSYSLITGHLICSLYNRQNAICFGVGRPEVITQDGGDGPIHVHSRSAWLTQIVEGPP